MVYNQIKNRKLKYDYDREKRFLLMKVIGIRKNEKFVQCDFCNKLLIYNEEEVLTTHDMVTWNSFSEEGYSYCRTYKLNCPSCGKNIILRRKVI